MSEEVEMEMKKKALRRMETLRSTSLRKRMTRLCSNGNGLKVPMRQKARIC